MTPPQRSSRKKPPLRPPPEENGVVQLKVWLLGISPMIWRRLLVPSTCTLRELHGVIQARWAGKAFISTSSASPNPQSAHGSAWPPSAGVRHAEARRVSSLGVLFGCQTCVLTCPNITI
ncbi:MAG: IS1096 element passenger TnpR family protein [Acetobacteraceae bacterium]